MEAESLHRKLQRGDILTGFWKLDVANINIFFFAVIQIDRSLASRSQIRSCTYPSLFRFFFYVPPGLPMNHGTISEQGLGFDVLVQHVARTVFFR